VKQHCIVTDRQWRAHFGVKFDYYFTDISIISWKKSFWGGAAKTKREFADCGAEAVKMVSAC